MNSIYRKQMKNQYAQDDPAFMILLAGCIIINSAALSIVLHLDTLSFIRFILWFVIIDCIIFGSIIATLAWSLSNKFLKKDALSSEDVTWSYAFDVHLNAIFPSLIILHIFQSLLYNYFISLDWFIARLFGNTLWLISVIYYCYISYLGYHSLPYLKDTKYILYATVPMLFIYLISIVVDINLIRVLMDFYQYQFN